MRVLIGCGLVVATAAALAACGGGGGGSSPAPPPGAATPTPAATKSPSPTASPTIAPTYVVGGTVVQIPVDAYGPAMIDGYPYASADAAQTAPLAGATVIIGPIPIAGATPPPTLPVGDVMTTTNVSGAFVVTLTVAPGAPSSAEPFVVPQDNLSGFTPPTTGYYVQVFGIGTDGKSAGTPVPLHHFLAASTSLALRVSTIAPAEAGALAAVNSDRASNAGAGPLIFDEDEEEVARLHASDEAANAYTCHYDLHNVGPSSRYLAVGGIGLTGEAIALVNASSVPAAFAAAESAFVAEKSEAPPGPHYLTLVDPSHNWAGLAAYPTAGQYEVDYDLGTSTDNGSTGAASGYPNEFCPSGIVANES